MSLFGKLFDKKVCDICGGEIGLLGNRKLENGNLCKNCAAKLSPFMTDRRQSTVDEIREHLAYREENREAVMAMHPTRVFGSYMKVFVDEDRGQFFVTSRRDWERDNPDIIDLSQVIDCRVRIDENRRELYDRAPDGKQVRFNPPRYEFSYEFDVHILVDSPYFDEIRFELTGDRPHDRYSPDYRAYEIEANELQNMLRPDLYPIVDFPPLPVPPLHPFPHTPGPMRPAPVPPRPAPGPVHPAPGPVRPEPVRPAPAPVPPRPMAPQPPRPAAPVPPRPAAPQPPRPAAPQQPPRPAAPQQPGPGAGAGRPGQGGPKGPMRPGN